jgi:DNA-binding SARP family transcriptional activator/Tfp pilus assembly protein PilF/TolB-like protein
MWPAKFLHIYLLGRVSIEDSSGVPIRISSLKGRALIAYLAMAPDLRAGREELAHLLWGDRSDGQARQNLRQCLIALRRDLGPRSSALITMAESVALDADSVWIDAIAFEVGTPSHDVAEAERASALYRGEFLKGLPVETDAFTAWAGRERERLQRIATQAVEERVAKLDIAGDGRSAIVLAESLVAADPLREDWQRSLLLLYARYNCREAALQHAQKFSAHLKEELGADPEPATKDLIDRIFRNEFTPLAIDRNGAISHPAPALAALPTGAGAQPLALPALPTETAGLDRLPLAGLVRTRPRLVASLVLVAALLAALLAGREFAASLRGLRSVDAAAPAAADVYRASIQILPFTMAVGSAAEKDIGERIRTDLADRLSQYSAFRVVELQPGIAAGRSRYAVGGEIRPADDGPRVLLRLMNDEQQMFIDQAQLHVSPLDYDERLVRWVNKLRVMITLLEGRTARESKETGEPMQVRKGLAARSRGISRESYAEALHHFEEALRLNPNSVPAMAGIAAQLITGGANFVAVQDERSDQLARADTLLQRAIELQPRSEGTHYWLGQLHNNRNELEAALQSFMRALELNPNYMSAQAALGNVLARMGREGEGIEKFSQAVQKAPDDPGMGTWMSWWARAEIERGNEAFARELLLVGSQREPGNARALGFWAAADALVNDSVAAAQHLAKFKVLSGAESLTSAVERLRAQVGPESRTGKGLAMALRGTS